MFVHADVVEVDVLVGTCIQAIVALGEDFVNAILLVVTHKGGE